MGDDGSDTVTTNIGAPYSILDLTATILHALQPIGDGDSTFTVPHALFFLGSDSHNDCVRATQLRCV